jgi:hypothetical protein
LKYEIETPNAFYNGETVGVKFTNGKGTTEDANKRNQLVNEYGYKDVTKVEEKPKTTAKKKTSSPK